MRYTTVDFAREKFTEHPLEVDAARSKIGVEFTRREALRMVPPAVAAWIEYQAKARGINVLEFPRDEYHWIVRDDPKGRLHLDALEAIIFDRETDLPVNIQRDAKEWAQAALDRVRLGKLRLTRHVLKFQDDEMEKEDEEVEEKEVVEEQVEVPQEEEDTDTLDAGGDTPPADLPDEEVEKPEEPEQEDVELNIDIFAKMANEEQKDSFMEYVANNAAVEFESISDLPQTELQRLYNLWIDTLDEDVKVELFTAYKNWLRIYNS